MLTKYELYPQIDANIGCAFKMFYPDCILLYKEIEEWLIEAGARNIIPEDKKHLRFSGLSPESIMIMHWLNKYCN